MTSDNAKTAASTKIVIVKKGAKKNLGTAMPCGGVIY